MQLVALAAKSAKAYTVHKMEENEMKNLSKLTALALSGVLALSLAACGKKSDSGVKILVPNDTTNEARALLLLQENGIITLKDGAGITATKNDIVDNPYNVEIVEAEAAQLPSLLADAEYAVINSNYAINAGLNPVCLLYTSPSPRDA